MRHTHASHTKPAPALHVCPECGSGLVQPTCWEQTSDREHWRLWRRCPECEWHDDAVYGAREIDDFDEQLDLGTRELADELKALEHSNMTELAETFIAALEADLIDPEDFR